MLRITKSAPMTNTQLNTDGHAIREGELLAGALLGWNFGEGNAIAVTSGRRGASL